MSAKEKTPQNNGWPSSDGSTVKVSWFEEGAHAVVHITRNKTGVTFRMSRPEAEVLRRLLPAEMPDEKPLVFGGVKIEMDPTMPPDQVEFRHPGGKVDRFKIQS